jgi:hypothetical protein
LVEYYAHRGGTAKLGVKPTAAHCVSISKAISGVKHTAAYCASLSKAKVGMKSGLKLTTTHCARISKAKLGEKHTAAHCASMSKARLGVTVEYSAANRAKEDEKFYDNVNKMKWYQQVHGHTLGDNGPLHISSFNVRKTRSLDGKNALESITWIKAALKL